MSVVPFNNSSNENVTEIPSNLEELPKDELVRLVKRVAGERDEQLRVTKKQKTNVAFAADAAAPSFDVAAAKKRITTTATRAIKKAAHNRSKKPWTEINEMVPTVPDVMGLFDGFDPTSDTARLIKWELHGSQVVEWLGCPQFVHPVKFDGKVWCFGGGPAPKIHAWAGYEKLQVKYEKKSGSLQLKFRTYMAGTGNPMPGCDFPPSTC